MRLLILISLISLTACNKKPAETVFLVPQFETETLTPCPISGRWVATANDLAALAAENLKTAVCANSKITAIAEVLERPDVPSATASWHPLKRTAPQ